MRLIFSFGLLASVRGHSEKQFVAIGVAGDAPSSWACVANVSANSAAASGTYVNQSLSGWGVLHVYTADASMSNWTDDHAAFAAGCVEAYLTHTQIFAYLLNYVRNEYVPDHSPPTKLLDFMQSQQDWVRLRAAGHSELPGNGTEDRFWRGMSLLMRQFDGLVAGVAAFATDEERMLLNQSTLYLLQAVGDLEDLNDLFKRNGSVAGATSTRRRQGHRDPSQLDCSALISLLPRAGASEPWSPGAPVFDIAAGHTTWRSYYAMLRVYKVYHLRYTPQKIISIASSPGLLHSKDDFLATPQLVVMETTNSVKNETLFAEFVSPATALSWQRSALATQWATGGEDWVSLFRLYNRCASTRPAATVPQRLRLSAVIARRHP